MSPWDSQIILQSIRIHGSFSKVDHTIGHKRILNKIKKTEIISSIFSDHNGMEL